MILLSLACKNPATLPSDSDAPPPPMLDVSERLAPGQTRAGVIASDAALFGGVSAEGQIGDFKIYNDRAQFVIQGVRMGSYYLELGGGVIDADMVRPEGEVGRDFVEEWNVMLGFGRVIDPTSVEVLSNGDDGVAHIRVTGTDAPLSLLVGVLESGDLVQSQNLDVVIDYKLGPDSPLLEVTTTVTASQSMPSFAMGDLLLGAPELSNAWTSGAGLGGGLGEKAATGYIGARNNGAIAILGAPNEVLRSSAAADLLVEVVDLVLGFDEAVSLEPGQSHSWTRRWGAGPDMASLTDAAVPGRVESGTVTAPDGPVAGARIHVLVDDSPYTVAVSGADGSFSAMVPETGAVSLVTDAAGRGMFFELPEGAPAWAPFAVDGVKDQAALALAGGSPARPYAQGRGVVVGTEVGEPGTVRVSVTDGDPFTVRVGPADAFLDRRVAVARPNGLAAAGWSRGGTLDLLVEPGTYDVLMHRGIRYDVHSESVTVAAGEVVDVSGTLDVGFDHPGYVFGDPHSHAAPSGDGQVSMEERLLIHAAAGVEVHFGTDHDRVADYRPLVDALELPITSIVADEVSPVLRGHMNTYPLEPDPTLPNHGAVSWWTEIPTTTQSLVDRIRERHGDVIVASNHPTDSGLAEAANWSPGLIGSGDFWVMDLNAMEVLNDGAHGEYFDVWLDLTSRGYLMAPVGVSDAHGHFSGPAGVNGTWIAGSMPLSNESLMSAYQTGDVQASLGVFLDLSEAPGSTFTSATTLEVTALSAPYVVVDRIHLYENGEIVETVAGTVASFELDPPADTVYVVVAEGDSPMQPVSNRSPWVATNTYLFDRGGDGWVAPLPPLGVE